MGLPKRLTTPESPGTIVPGLFHYHPRMLPHTADLLAALVRLPSVNPMGRTDVPPDIAHESRVIDYLDARLRDLGVAGERQTVAPGRDNLIARYSPRRTRRSRSSGSATRTPFRSTA